MFVTCILADASEPVLVEDDSNAWIGSSSELNCYTHSSSGRLNMARLLNTYSLKNIYTSIYNTYCTYRGLYFHEPADSVSRVKYTIYSTCNEVLIGITSLPSPRFSPSARPRGIRMSGLLCLQVHTSPRNGGPQTVRKTVEESMLCRCM